MKILNKISDKLIGTEILGLDINNQWYDTINNVYLKCIKMKDLDYINMVMKRI